MEIFSAIILAALVATILGFLWYSPFMFGRKWMELSGIPVEQMDCAKTKGMGKVMAVNSALTLLTAFITYIVIGLGLDFVGVVSLWAGFALPVYAAPCLWEKKSWKLFYINAGFGLVSVVFMSEVIRWFL